MLAHQLKNIFALHLCYTNGQCRLGLKLKPSIENLRKQERSNSINGVIADWKLHYPESELINGIPWIALFDLLDKFGFTYGDNLSNEKKEKANNWKMRDKRRRYGGCYGIVMCIILAYIEKEVDGRIETADRTTKCIEMEKIKDAWEILKDASHFSITYREVIATMIDTLDEIGVINREEDKMSKLNTILENK